MTAQDIPDGTIPDKLPPVDRKPVYSEPGVTTEWDEDADAMRIHGIGWALSWGCQLSLARDHDTGEHYVSVCTSGRDQRDGITTRSATREQIASFGQQVVNVFGEPDLRDAEIERLRDGKTAAYREAARLSAELERIVAFVGGSAAMPGSVRSAVEHAFSRRDAKRDAEIERLQVVVGRQVEKIGSLRQKLDQHLADENSAQAVNDRLREQNEELRRETNKRADEVLRRGAGMVERIRAALRIEGNGTTTRANLDVLSDYVERLIDTLNVNGEYWKGLVESRGAQLDEHARDIRELAAERDSLRRERDFARKVAANVRDYLVTSSNDQPPVVDAWHSEGGRLPSDPAGA